MDDLQKAIQVLKKGGIVIFPTDTAFGIGCRIDDKKAIARLFKLRRRPKDKPVPVLVGSVKMAQDYLLAPLPDNVRHLMSKYWPGGLTIVFPCKRKQVPSLVRGGGKTLGIRMPNHRKTLNLIKGVGVPILGPSANFHGQNTPYQLEDIDSELIALVDYLLPGRCPLTIVSTVVDCSSKPYKIIRQGAVKLDKTELKGKQVILFIDTSSNQEVILSLETDGKKSKISKKTQRPTSQILLSLIDKLLRKNKLSPSNISEVKVNLGPGSFTGLRVGISVANVFGWLFDIPVNGQKGKIVVPAYS